MERASPGLRELLGEDSVVDARRETELARRDGGKFRAVASVCRQGTES
jgi:hypothetical protein